jgi:hypothetical protein
MLPLVVKLIAAAVAAAFGFYATFHDLREDRDGKKVLVGKGKLGIALLIVATLLSMSSDAVQAYKDARERARAADEEAQKRREDDQKRREDVERIQRITHQLDEQLATSRETSGVLSDALKTLKGNTDSLGLISGGLGTQLAITKGVSTNLGGVARNLMLTSNTSNRILEETVERVDSLEVRVFVAIDPFAVKDASGKSVLSEGAVKLLEQDRAGAIDLSEYGESQKVILADLQRHHELVRQLVFEEWEIGIILDKFHDEFFDFLPNMLFTQHGYQGALDMFTVAMSEQKLTGVREHKGYRGVVCMVTYTIPPNRAVGFRKFSDLNGANWLVSLRADWNVLEVEGAMLSAGGLFGGFEMKKEDFVPKEGRFVGQKTVPDDHFRRADVSSN